MTSTKLPLHDANLTVAELALRAKCRSMFMRAAGDREGCFDLLMEARDLANPALEIDASAVMISNLVARRAETIAASALACALARAELSADNKRALDPVHLIYLTSDAGNYLVARGEWRQASNLAEEVLEWAILASDRTRLVFAVQRMSWIAAAMGYEFGAIEGHIRALSVAEQDRANPSVLVRHGLFDVANLSFLFGDVCGLRVELPALRRPVYAHTGFLRSVREAQIHYSAVKLMIARGDLAGIAVRVGIVEDFDEVRDHIANEDGVVAYSPYATTMANQEIVFCWQRMKALEMFANSEWDAGADFLEREIGRSGDLLASIKLSELGIFRTEALAQAGRNEDVLAMASKQWTEMEGTVFSRSQIQAEYVAARSLNLPYCAINAFERLLPLLLRRTEAQTPLRSVQVLGRTDETSHALFEWPNYALRAFATLLNSNCEALDHAVRSTRVSDVSEIPSSLRRSAEEIRYQLLEAVDYVEATIQWLSAGVEERAEKRKGKGIDRFHREEVERADRLAGAGEWGEAIDVIAEVALDAQPNRSLHAQMVRLIGVIAYWAGHPNFVLRTWESLDLTLLRPAQGAETLLIGALAAIEVDDLEALGHCQAALADMDSALADGACELLGALEDRAYVSADGRVRRAAVAAGLLRDHPSTSRLTSGSTLAALAVPLARRRNVHVTPTDAEVSDAFVESIDVMMAQVEMAPVHLLCEAATQVFDGGGGPSPVIRNPHEHERLLRFADLFLEANVGQVNTMKLYSIRYLADRLGALEPGAGSQASLDAQRWRHRSEKLEEVRGVLEAEIELLENVASRADTAGSNLGVDDVDDVVDTIQRIALIGAELNQFDQRADDL